MKVVKVKSCDGCPFEDDGDGRPWCKIDEQKRLTDPPYLVTWDRPYWCPLELGPVTVEVDRG